MSIQFDRSRWEQIRETYRLWWKDELERPIVPVELNGRDPGRAEPDVPLLSQANCHDLSIPADDIVDRLDYELSTKVYLGDAFPYVNLDAFGPGIVTAMLGAKLDNASGHVWFFPTEDKPISEIHFEFDPDNVWFRRIRDICLAANRRWQGEVLVGMPDLGGNLDILSVFRPSEKLLFDLYDCPDEVKRLHEEAHRCWHQVYEAINGFLQPTNPGYTDWSGIFSDRPSYMLQCDFSHMIGPEMFEEFAKPELTATCEMLPYSFYHLDGARAHLESVLEIKALDGVQWVPGAGHPDCDHWPEVYQAIHATGKKIQVISGDFDILDTILSQIGSSRGVHELVIRKSVDEENEVKHRLQRYGIE